MSSAQLTHNNAKSPDEITRHMCSALVRTQDADNCLQLACVLPAFTHAPLIHPFDTDKARP